MKITEVELHNIAIILKLLIEGAALCIIAFSVIKTVAKFIRSYRKKNSEEFYHEIRLDLGLSLALALEFLLAADIVGTAINPSWEAIGLLAAIAGIRTFLNYFLQIEVNELEAKKYKDSISNR
ncbi:MAG: DUF1622 domain-containing protein [Xenococcaceae cyanobacterium MO_207.B15]|nr:DUF1622 domain-containing protein [Xenococcaceae cyanobacterium MO_207.B15]MDJ0742787.1 DUF1622 domain-containing protein [Xenococcaceae cyanobacterium MO_167.B27]